jgi:hypothetical protein
VLALESAVAVRFSAIATFASSSSVSDVTKPGRKSLHVRHAANFRRISVGPNFWRHAE